MKQAIDALASQRGEVIVPSGAATANTHGLTAQVPVRSIYLTSDRTRTMNLGDNWPWGIGRRARQYEHWLGFARKKPRLH